MKSILVSLAILIVVLVMIGRAGNRWLGAASQGQGPVGTTTTIRTMDRPLGTRPPPGWKQPPEPRHPSVVHEVGLKVNAEVLPGRRVKVTAHSDIFSSPSAEHYLYLWKLDFTRKPAGQRAEVAWSWVYENSLITVKPGAHLTPDFADTVVLPPGEYKARASLLRMTWEDGVDGLQLVPVPDDYRLTSCRVVVE